MRATQHYAFEPFLFELAARFLSKMRDTGLQEAIRAVGGVSELARRIGISQPSVSNWDRIPAERVLTVENATGINRAILRPDLFGAYAGGDVDETDAARAQEYALLAALLARAPDAALLKRLSELRGDATPLGVAHVALAEAASKTTCRTDRARILRPLHRARSRRTDAVRLLLSDRLPARDAAGAAARRSRRRSASSVPRANVEPEDHAAILCEIMAGLAARRLRARIRAPTRKFSTSTWRRGSGASSPISRRATRRISIARVGALGRVFIDIETEAFSLPS